LTFFQKKKKSKKLGGKIWWKYYVFMNENGKMRPIEIVSGMGDGRIKENDGEGEFNYDIL
jgi:hypothetical protein